MVVPYDLAPEGGGVKQHALHLSEALRRLGNDVTIIGPASAPMTDPDMHTFGGVVNIPHNGSDNMLGLLISPREVWRYFRTHPFDVVHFHEPQSPAISYWAAWATLRTAHVATFHAYSEANSALRARQLSGKTIFPWIQRAIAVSPSAARYAAATWKRPLTIIPNGVPTRLFRPRSNVPAAHGPFKLLFVGRLGDVRKGARYMLEAYAGLRAQGADVVLDVVGELGRFGPLPDLPGLTYWGEVDTAQLTQRYRECDALVAPSTGQESFGIILLEAMASGKPVVCSDIDGYRGVIDERGALFAPACDVPALQARLLQLMAMGPAARAQMGHTNLRRVRDFDWDAIVHRVHDEYRAAITAAASSPVSAALR